MLNRKKIIRYMNYCEFWARVCFFKKNGNPLRPRQTSKNETLRQLHCSATNHTSRQ
jgi:hypothetical protein